MAKKNLEIEMKAQVADLAPVRSKLEKLGSLKDKIDYRDTYFVQNRVKGYSFKRFRLRETGCKAWVTAKQKVKGAKSSKAMAEHEFEISDAGAFRKFTGMFGFKKLIEKRKKGSRYAVEFEGSELTVELIEIEGLGFFVEIELMAARPGDIVGGLEKIAALFKKLGIPHSAVEQRPYTLMLYEKTMQGDNE